MQDMTREHLYARTGEPTTERVVRSDGAPLDHRIPPEVVIPVWLGVGSDKITLADAPILLTDFGEAFDPKATKRFTAHTPLLLAPPESRFLDPGADEPLSFPGDIWTLACTIWDLFGDSPPFEAFPVTPDDVTIEQVETLGRLPDRWWRKWETRSNWFDEDGRKNVKGSLLQWYDNSSRGWDQRFPGDILGPRKSKKFDTFSAAELKAFHDMIKSMLVLEPAERATIENVYGCEWMQRWGLPELQHAGYLK